MTDAGRSRAWMVSMAAHAVIGTVLLMALGTGHTHRKPIEPEPPKRLVWVEPAPLALGVPGGRAAPPAAPAEPASVVPPPSVSETKPPPGRVVAKEPKPRPKPPRLARTGDAKPEAIERPKPPLPVEPASAAVPSEAARAAPSAGAPGGVQQGTVNGAAGGFGDAAVPVGSVAAPPELVERVVPEYPPRARPEADIKVLKSVKLLDAAAIAAVRQWRFRPARGGDGRAVRVVMEVPVRFVLR
jgi:protein TonB